MTKFFALLITLLSVSVAYGQNIILRGDKQYKATPEWKFKCPLEVGIGNLNVQIAKNGDSGYLKLSIYSNEGSNYIGGNVYLYLEDGAGYNLYRQEY